MQGIEVYLSIPRDVSGQQVGKRVACLGGGSGFAIRQHALGFSLRRLEVAVKFAVLAEFQSVALPDLADVIAGAGKRLMGVIDTVVGLLRDLECALLSHSQQASESEV